MQYPPVRHSRSSQSSSAQFIRPSQSSSGEPFKQLVSAEGLQPHVVQTFGLEQPAPPAQRQLPPLHVSLAPQGAPQPPQCVALARRSVSHPFAWLPSQLPQLAAQVTT